MLSPQKLAFNSLRLYTFQTINFTDPFYAPPVVIVTPKHSYLKNYSLSTAADSHCNTVTAWVEVSSMDALRSVLLIRNRNGETKRA